MKLQLTIITLALISIAIPPIYASHPVPFDDWVDHDCETLDDGTFRCDWTPGSTTALSKDEPTKAPEETGPPSTPMPDEDQEPSVIIAVTKPDVFERKIIELQKKIEEDGYLPSHEGQLLRALLSLKEACEYGTEEAAPIQTYELFYIATFDPYVHTDLGTQYILKLIETEIENCKAQDILKKKVLGPQYLHIPGSTDVTPPHVFRDNFDGLEWDDTKGLDNPTYAFNERHMTAFNFDKSIQVAEGFQCSKPGKQQGHCPKQIGDQPIPKPTISKAGKQALNAYWLLRETGVAEIPFQDPEADPREGTINTIKSMMRAQNITTSDLEDDEQ